MLFSFGVSVLFRHAKIDNMNDICSFGIRSTDEEVVWFDVAIDEVLFVDRLDSRELGESAGTAREWETDHLLSYHHNGLDRESSITVIKQIFEGRTK